MQGLQRWQRGRLVAHSAVVSVLVVLAVRVVSGCSLPFASSAHSPASAHPGHAHSSKVAAAAAPARSMAPAARLAQISLGLKPFITGLTAPTQLTYAPDGSDRVYITEQAVLIRAPRASGSLSPP